MIVAGTQVRIAANAAIFAAHDEHQLGMGFQADDAVDHLHAGLLQARGEFDVGLFVKACA